ncbi:hypothetical protein PACTADRAFT_74179 [Pachysolen tannophilus NRRL Y-2460]|uniref:Uncharacterized protein n=1 Tax=Pachysolen tannophilus NRRL Y-2460 TaxID=669874 RepID=A0A1E4TXT5_PACTA|nr:hypothetical protein PACTADRAFT_74179 [Pachysolen tannophilus NRRL Y-2460]
MSRISGIETPQTPSIPNPNSEINLKTLEDIESHQNFDLDLNPDLSEDDDDVDNDDVLEPANDDEIIMETSLDKHTNSSSALEQFKKENKGIESLGSSTSLKSTVYPNISSDGELLDDGGFLDVIEHRNSPINPFKEVIKNEETDDNKINDDYDIIPRQEIINNASSRGLSLPQQSKIINYIDERLLKVHRKFIKHLSYEEDFDNDDNGDDDKSGGNSPKSKDYSISELMNELSEIVHFIWYSIYQTKEIPNVQQIHSLPRSVHPDRIFGQTNYLIKIMGDSVDFIVKYEFNNLAELLVVLTFLKNLDNFISILIDQSEHSRIKLINNTEKIRIISIINRTKILILEKFEKLKLKSLKERSPEQENELIKDHHHNNKRDFNSLITNHHSHDNDNTNPFYIYGEKIGEVYEGILERTSI